MVQRRSIYICSVCFRRRLTSCMHHKQSFRFVEYEDSVKKVTLLSVISSVPPIRPDDEYVSSI